MGRDEKALAEFAERMAGAMTGAGFPRMPARVLMTLTIADGAGLTAAELAERLSASPAAVSGAVRYLVQLSMIHRVPQSATRRDRYELPAHGAWYTATLGANPLYDTFFALAVTGAEAAGGPADPVGARLAEMSDFFGFLRERMPRLLEEWRATR